MQNGKVSAKLMTVALVCALGLGGAIGRALSHLSDTAGTASQPTVAAGQQQPQKRYAVPFSTSLPYIGPNDAVVTIVEWCDLPDAGCAALEPKMQALLKANPEMMRLVSRHYPTAENPFSSRAHEFAAAAHKNAGKFWEARALLLGHKGQLTDADLERFAGQLGLDWEGTKKALDDHQFVSGVRADQLFAAMFDLHSSPGVFINGRYLGEHPTPERLEQVFNEEARNAIDMVVRGVDKAEVYAKLTDKGAFTPLQRAQP
jgi:protein-disulfide isomerase